jgi:hypothetical protein
MLAKRNLPSTLILSYSADSKDQDLRSSSG